LRASKKPLGDLAWDYMKTRRDWRKLVKEPEYHDSAYLLEGLEENYRGRCFAPSGRSRCH
jgi:hypothetical protein